MNAPDLDDNDQENDNDDSVQDSDDSDQASEGAQPHASQSRVRSTNSPIIINK